MKKNAAAKSSSTAPAARAVTGVKTTTPVAEITHEMIARRAFEIWCGKGRPWGGESDNWRQAELELAAELGFATPSRAPRGARARA
ncbi:MAG TPA: DUF2934 domain-containing protein [bacterium]|nr:DUF2934 domain-containing protein [bacterium]